MPRGKKNLTLEEQLDKISSEIDELEETLKERKKDKKDLENQIKQNRLAEIEEIITSSGKTLDEVKNILINKE